MEEPKKEKYGWVDKNTFDGEPGGWTIEGGEEAYTKSRKEWGEEDAETCPDCFDRGWIYNEDGSRTVCPCLLK